MFSNNKTTRNSTSETGVGIIPLRLRNQQNSCFLNTALNIFYSVKNIRELFLSIRWQTGPLIEEQPICAEIRRIFQNAGVVDSASRLRFLVYQYTGDNRFFRGTQKDSVEFLDTLINCVDLEMPPHLRFAQKFQGEMTICKKFVNR